MIRKESSRTSSNKWTKTLYQEYLIARFAIKLLCECFKYLLKKARFQKRPNNVENKFWTSHETLESTGEMTVMMKFYLCLHNFSELWNIFSRAPMGNWFRCYFRQLFTSLALRKSKNGCKIPKNIPVPGFCLLKTKIARFPIGFRLNVLAIESHGEL